MTGQQTPTTNWLILSLGITHCNLSLHKTVKHHAISQHSNKIIYTPCTSSRESSRFLQHLKRFIYTTCTISPLYRKKHLLPFTIHLLVIFLSQHSAFNRLAPYAFRAHTAVKFVHSLIPAKTENRNSVRRKLHVKNQVNTILLCSYYQQTKQSFAVMNNAFLSTLTQQPIEQITMTCPLITTTSWFGEQCWKYFLFPPLAALSKPFHQPATIHSLTLSQLIVMDISWLWSSIKVSSTCLTITTKYQVTLNISWKWFSFKMNSTVTAAHYIITDSSWWLLSKCLSDNCTSRTYKDRKFYEKPSGKRGCKENQALVPSWYTSNTDAQPYPDNVT